MSASFPSIPGFIGPLSLKTFLEDFFSLRLTFGSNAETTGPSKSRAVSRHALQEVSLPINESFIVIVYVAQHAPAAPLPVGHHHALQHDKTSATTTNSRSGFLWSKNSTTSFASRKKKQWSSASVASAKQSSNSAWATPSSTAPWLLYTETVHRPFTHALLQHPWWSPFSALLGPAAIAFVEVYCPVVLQLEATAGGVQVIGPALPHTAPLVAPVAAAVRRWRETKRERDEPTYPPTQKEVAALPKKTRWEEGTTAVCTTAATAKKHGSTCNQRKRSRRGKGTFRRRDEAKPTATAQTTWAAVLPRTDVSRTRLYSTAAAAAAEDASLAGTDDARPLAASLLEALWLAHHPQSLRCAVHSALPQWQAARMMRAADSSPHNGEERVESTPLCLPLCYVRHVFRWMELKPATCAGPDAAPTGLANAGSFDVSGHLQLVLSVVLDQCTRLDLRGAALKHLSYLEARCQRQRQGKEPSDVQRLTAPVDVVVAYLRTLLSQLRWPFTAASRDAEAAGSFWGGAEDGGRARLMEALLASVRAWLSAGRHATFPVSRFLDGVPVGRLPWLAGFFTTPASKSPSSMRHARCQRSQIQQRVWLQFVLFLTQDIFPFLVRASFAVTWSSKNANLLLFFPLSVWRCVVRCELHRAIRSHIGFTETNVGVEREVVGDSTTVVDQRDDAPATERLRRLSTSAASIDERVAAATLTSRGGQPSLLYAAVRFRPDGRKLRPIAVLRSAAPRSLKEVACGTPSPYSHPASVLRLLAATLAWAGSTVPPSTTGTFAWMRRMQGKGKRVLALHQSHSPLSTRRTSTSGSSSPPHKNALREAFRCLVSGVEEEQVRSGLPKLSNLAHQDEYAELRSFCEEARKSSSDEFEVGDNNNSGGEQAAQLKTGTGSSGNPTSIRTPPRVFLVRSDASRCYDTLPQSRVLEEADALVHHDAYRTLSFTDLCGVADNSSGSELLLLSTRVTRTVPCSDIVNGRLARIPRGHIYWEDDSNLDKKQHRTDARAAASSGIAVRALLREHLQRHFIVLDGHLFEQCVGLLQGSPVAMLLCDRLFARTVDVSLSCILSEHAERSLLLRRVDDVLVATTSPVAAQRCLQAMQRGWPSVGYHSNPQKLTMSSARGGYVPWCGLLLHDTTLESSVEWRRMRPLLPSVLVADTCAVHRGDSEPLRFTQRLLAVIHLRVPPTALCGRVNSTTRALQTFYEAALLWSRLVVWKVQAALSVAHHRCIAVLLLRPLAACVARLCRLLRRHDTFLRARRSRCDVSDTEVRACVLTALHRTLQAKLRVLLLVTARSKRPSSLRAFWWCAASQVESQWRGALTALKSAAGTADLLRDTGPSSLHARALQATQPLFTH